MKIKVLQENLIKALARTGRVISVKSQLPVLQNVLLATEGGMLKITASNLETTVSTLVGVKIEKEGGLCVSAKVFSEFVTSLPQETVAIEEKTGSLFVHTSRAKATIPGVPMSEFPAVKLIGKEKGIALDWDVFQGALGSVLFAAASDEGRPLLTGVKMVKTGDSLLFAATDGYRLSVRRVALGGSSAFDMVVPARALFELNRALLEDKSAKPSDKIKRSVGIEKTDDGQIVFVVDDTRIATRVIDGEYPNFEKIIPVSHTTTASIDKEELLRAVKSAAIFARDNANIVRIHLEKSSVTVSANTPQVGENTIELEARVEGDGGDIAFNSRFLIEYLSNIQAAEVGFEMTGSLNPGVFKIPGDDGFLHIIMPVRVQA